MSETIYRPQALQRFSSPERVNQLLKVAGTKSWAAFLGIACVLGAVLLWGIWGSVPVDVAGNGIIRFRAGGTRATVAQGTGLLSDVLVQPGDTVRQGQVIARLDMTTISQQLSDAKVALANLQKERARLVVFYADYLGKELVLLDAQKQQYTSMQAHVEEQVKALDGLARGVSSLRKKGFASLSQEQTVLLQYNAAVRDRDTAHADRLQIETQWQSLQNQRDTALDGVDEKIVAARNQVNQFEEMLRVGGTVRAPVSGTVVQFEAQPHTMLSTGTTIALIEFGRVRASAVIYVPAIDGKLIRPGMAVKISPTTVPPEEYGSILGVVEHVGAYPASPTDMMRVLNNQALVNAFAAGGVPLEVLVSLKMDPSNVSGFAWTSKDGPPLRITAGTIASARIVVESDPPITLILPFLRKEVGWYW